MGMLVWYCLAFLMSDSQLCKLVNNPLVVPTRKESFDEQPILLGIMPSDNMDQNALASCQEASLPPEDSSKEKQRLRTHIHAEPMEKVEQGPNILDPKAPQDLPLEARHTASL